MKNTREETEHICACCENSVPISESNLCICKINGAVSASDTCKKFKLDLLKLEPHTRKLPDEDTVFFEI